MHDNWASSYVYYFQVFKNICHCGIWRKSHIQMTDKLEIDISDYNRLLRNAQKKKKKSENSIVNNSIVSFETFHEDLTHINKKTLDYDINVRIQRKP